MPVVVLNVKEDNKGAERLSERLKERGYEIWRCEDILPGASIPAELSSRMLDHTVVVYATRSAVGTTSITSACHALASLKQQDGKNRLLIAKMEGAADVQLLGRGIEPADFSQHYEIGLERLCQALGAPVSLLNLQAITQQFVKHNGIRVTGYVGEKYRPELYVSRNLERQVRAFASDPRALIRTCVAALSLVLEMQPASVETGRQRKRVRKILALNATERAVAQQAYDSCQNGGVLQDQTALQAFIRTLLPPCYNEVIADLHHYRDYILGDPSRLSIRRLKALHDQLQLQFARANVSSDAVKALKKVWEALTARAVLNEPDELPRGGQTPWAPIECLDTDEPDVVTVVRNLSSSESNTQEFEDFTAARRCLQTLEREIHSWSRARLLAVRMRKSRKAEADQPVWITADYVLERCESLLEAASRQCLLIVDAAGSGKTNMLSAISLDQHFGIPTIVLFAKAFDEHGSSVEAALNQVVQSDLRSLGRMTDFEEFLTRMHDELERRQTYVIVMIDGINETANDAALAQSLRLTVAKYQHQRVRFVATCRDIYWSFFSDALQGPGYKLNQNGLRRYSDSEFAIVLDKYLKAYGLSNVTIEAWAFEALRSPILLRFFCEAYGTTAGVPQSHAPTHVRTINLKHLFDDYLKSKVRDMANRSEVKVLYGKHKEKQTLVDRTLKVAAKIREVQRPYLLRDEVAGVLGDGDIDSRVSVYQLLLDEDIILEERQGRVFFVYEAFMEYAIAKAMLRDADDGDVHDVLDCIVREKDRFRNMLGVMLMALVMLAEERQLTVASYILANKSDEWRPVVLAALAQMPSSRIDVDAIQALSNMCVLGREQERRQALKLLLDRGGKTGLAEVMRLLRRGSSERRERICELLPEVGGAKLLGALLEDYKQGEKNMKSALLALTPSRRGVKHLEANLQTDQEGTVVVILNMLCNVEPGDFEHAMNIARKHAHSRHEPVRQAALDCYSSIRKRMEESEKNRRSNISRARRRASASGKKPRKV